MEWQQILDELTVLRRGYPVAAARALLDDPEHYERMVAELERMSARPEELRESMFHLHAMHLLAERREPRAFRPLLAIAALPEADLDAALGDHLTESFKNCVAAVCDDETALRAFVEDRRHAQWARIAMINALTLPVFAGDREAAPLLAWLVETGDRTLAWLEAQHESVDTDAQPAGERPVQRQRRRHELLGPGHWQLHEREVLHRGAAHLLTSRVVEGE